MSKKELKRRIFELDFAIHELVLFLDTHPTSQKGLELLCEYRKIREELIRAYEEKFGEYIVHPDDVPANGCWKWLKGPWPWENDFMGA